MKSFAIHTALCAASCVFALLAAEVALRLTPLREVLPFENVPKGYYEADRDAGYDIARNFPTSTERFRGGSHPIWSNNLGCFDKTYDGEEPYIFLTGDSFAWGFSPFEDKWGTILEKSLGLRVVKCGVPGYGTRQELLKTKKMLAELSRPSLIVVSYFKNDADDDAAFPNSLVYEGKLIKNLSGDPSLSFDELQSRLPQFAQWAQEYCMWNMPAHPGLQRVKCYLRTHSVLYVLAQSSVKSLVPTSLLQRLGIVNYPPEAALAEEGNEKHLQTLKEFSELAQKEGVRLSVVFITPKEDAVSTATAGTYAEEKTFLEKEDIQYFDFTDDFRKVAHATSAPLYWEEDLHFNSAGNHLLGLLLSRELAPAHLKPSIEGSLRAEFGW